MTKALRKQIISFFIGPLACLIVSMLPPPEGMQAAGMLNLGACLWLITWWMTEVFPMPVTAVLSVPIFAFLGLLAPAKAFSFFGSPAVMLIFGATILVGLLKESNFMTRYAYWVLSRPFVRGSALRMLFVFTLSVGVLSAIAPNIPLAILFVSITVTLGRTCNMPSNNPLMRGMCVLSGSAPAVGGIGTPLGGAPNLVIIAMIAKVLDHEISFWEWSAMGMPLAIISLIIVSLLAYLYFLRGSTEKVMLSTDFMEEKLSELGPVTRYEHIAMGTIVVALVLWCFGPQIAGFVGWQAGVKMLNVTFVAILMGAITFLIPLKRNAESGAIEFAMTWKLAVRNISWDILVITLGILAFGEVLLNGGVDKWLAALIQGILGDVSGVLVLFFVIIFTGVCSQIVTNIALVSLVIPLTATLAANYGLNPLAACVAVGMTSNVAVMFPFSSVTAASAMMGGAEYMRPKDFAGFGLIVTLVISCVVFLLSLLLGNVLFPM